MVGGAGRPVVRLRDGRFLVVGSTSVYDGTASIDKPLAEIYDPAIDTWSVVAPPQHGHEGAVAALLPDGRVLIAGGRPGVGPDRLLHATAHAKSELFDPATGIWSPTGDLNRPRASGSGHGVLPGGEVAAAVGSWATVVGPFGQRRFGDIFHETSAEVFEPATGAWRAIPGAVYARSGGVAATLADGSMLVAAGIANGGFPITGRGAARAAAHPGPGRRGPAAGEARPAEGRNAAPRQAGPAPEAVAERDAHAQGAVRDGRRGVRRPARPARPWPRARAA